ncbi:MAG TPA: PAS domain S-box protein [Acidimicrobiales bacterium]|nr:PAS domain S-box protein [Acidimicrobiales bacterium]
MTAPTRSGRPDIGTLVSLAAVAYAALFVAWVAWGGGTTWQRTVISDAAMLPMTLGGAALSWRASLRVELPEAVRRSWRWITAAFLAWWAGDALWLFYEVVSHESPFPSAADAFRLSFYGLMLVAIVRAVRLPSTAGMRATLAIDVLTVSGIGGATTWYLIVRPLAGDTHASFFEAALTAAYPIGDLLLGVAISVALFAGRGRGPGRPLRLLACGAAVFVVADVLFARLYLAEQYDVGDWPDAFWMIALTVMLLAANAQHSAPVTSSRSVRASAVTRPFFPYAAVVLGYVLLLYAAPRESSQSAVVLVLVSFFVTCLVVVRHALVLRENVRLTEARTRLHTIVDSSSEAIFATSLVGTVTSWNRGAEVMYGWAEAEAVGRDIRDLIVPADLHEEIAQTLEDVKRGVSVKLHETWRRRKDGSMVMVTVCYSPIFADDRRVVGASAIGSDLTEVHQLAAALRAALSRAEDALAEVANAESTSRRFLSDAAHQLRTPLTSIRACSEALALADAAGQRTDLLDILVTESARAGSLIDDLLSIARAEHDRLVRKTPVDVVALCRAAVATLVPDESPIRTSVQVAGDAPPVVELDERAVSEILSNLLTNAKRHAVSCIDLFVTTTSTCVEIAVLNDGAQPHPAEYERIFERFVSLDGRGGTGLGLAIARAFARSCGGDLVYSDGAFRLRLPLSGQIGQ